MADYHTLFSTMFNPGAGNCTEALDLLEKLRAQAEQDPKSDTPFAFRCEAQDGQLWIEDDLSSDTESVIAFVLACAEKFDLKGRWGFEYSNSCSKPRLDAYGGGVIVIDLGAKTVESAHTHEIMEKWLAGEEAGV